MAIIETHQGTTQTPETQKADPALVTEVAGALALDSTARDLGGGGNGIPRADYELTPDQMDTLEADLFAEIRPQISEECQGIAVVAVPGNSRYAAFGRTSEKEHYETDFYDLHKSMIPYEDRSLFLYTVDTDRGAIGHVKRVVFARSPEEIAQSGVTGLEIVDDRILSEGEEHADLAEIMDYHSISDIGECLNVASNHRMIRPGTSKEKPYILASYKAVFEVTRQHGLHNVFAYLNTNAIRSFNSFGLQYELLVGKEFHVPNNAYDPEDPASEPFEKDYIAVCVSDSPENVKLFKDIGELIPATEAPIVTVSQ